MRWLDKFLKLGVLEPGGVGTGASTKQLNFVLT